MKPGIKVILIPIERLVKCVCFLFTYKKQFPFFLFKKRVNEEAAHLTASDTAAHASYKGIM